MSISDFLEKQLFIDKEIVTYRTLSRQFRIHVNQAKNELAKFHAEAKEPCSATYIISGQVPALPDDPEGGGEEEYAEEQRTHIRIVIVPESQRKLTESRFERVHGTHVYALSPVAIRDAELMTLSHDLVRKVDISKGYKNLGRIVDLTIKLKAPTNALVDKGKKPEVKPAVKASEKPKEKVVDKPAAAAAKPKATGKLDWSNAKSKKDAVAPAKKGETPPPAKKGLFEAKKKVVAHVPKIEAEDSKRGVKRKTVNSDDDGAAPPPPAPAAVKTTQSSRASSLNPNSKPVSSASSTGPSAPAFKVATGAHTKRGVVISDDEDEDEAPKPKLSRLTKGKTKARSESVDSVAQREELAAMMEVDDDEVTHISRKRPNTTPPSSDVEMGHADEDNVNVEEEEMDEDDDFVKPAPRKRATKKVIPVGSNGLKKRRVVKSKESIDAKGYMVTEDYTDWESVDEEEKEEVKPVKKAAPKEKPAPKEKGAPKEKAAPKPKPAPKVMAKNKNGKVVAGQASLSNFFSKK